MEEAKESGLPRTEAKDPQEGNEDDSSEDENFEPDELYDEGEDDANEDWVQKNIRKGRQGNTDAVLNCPCCFTTICMDCQRHAKVKTQFRAMFTVNCIVQTHTRVSPPSSQKPRGSRKGRAKQGEAQAAPESESGGGPTSMEEDGDEVLHPVVCATCGTVVGVQDSDEVVHFHNVIEG